jgi:hypothetical protein
VISEYAERLAARLRFDPDLAGRVQAEVEDHLDEAAAVLRRRGEPDPERAALSAFGDPRSITAGFAVCSLAAHARRTGVAVVLVHVAALVAMKMRLEWYVLTRWTLGEDLRPVGALIACVDRWAFWVAASAALAAWAYIGTRGAPFGIAEYRTPLRRFLALCFVAGTGLLVCVAADCALTGLRLAGAEPSAAFAVPLASVAIELACATALAARLHAVVRRTAQTEALEG